MKNRSFLLGVAFALAVPAFAYAADDQGPATRPTIERPADERGAGDRGPGQGGPGMRGPRGDAIVGGDPLMQSMSVLGLADLQPDFDLTKDQKTKIAGIHDTYKAQLDDWRKQHAEDIKKLIDEATEAFANAGQGGGGAREAMQKLSQERGDLVATAPKSDDAIQQIKAVLTDEQTKAVEAIKDQMDKQRQEQAQVMGRMMPGGGRGPRNRGGDGANPSTGGAGNNN